VAGVVALADYVGSNLEHSHKILSTFYLKSSVFMAFYNLYFEVLASDYFAGFHGVESASAFEKSLSYILFNVALLK
jgi:hypothetical protein